MAAERPRDKARTRARISREATQLFVERGFDDVTVAEVAAAAGVSKVTVFAHFPRKEDLLLDRGPEAVALLVSAVRDRGDGVGRAQAVRLLADGLTADGHPLFGLTGNSAPFLRTVVASRALQARAREWEAELEHALVDVLAEEPDPVTDPDLFAALTIAALRTLLIAAADQLLQGASPDEIATDHGRRVARAFGLLESAEQALT